MTLFSSPVRFLGTVAIAAMVVGCSLPPFPSTPAEPSPIALDGRRSAPAGGPPEAPKPYYYPQKPITLLVGSKRGTDEDVAGRLLSAQLEKMIWQPVVVANRPEGDGLEAWNQLKSASADGYTLGLVSSPQMQALALEPWNKASFTVNDFLPLAGQVRDPTVLFVRGWSPFRTVEELIGAAKAQPDKLPVSVRHKGVTSSLAAADFQQKAGVKLRIGTYVDAANALLAALNGQAEVAFCSFSSAVPMVRSGQGRLLAVMSEDRLPSQPSVPTLREKGIDLVCQTYLGYVAPKRTAPDVADYLLWSLFLAISDPGHQARMQEAGMSVRYMDGKQFGSLLAAEGERVGRLMRK